MFCLIMHFLYLSFHTRIDSLAGPPSCNIPTKAPPVLPMITDFLSFIRFKPMLSEFRYSIYPNFVDTQPKSNTCR